MSALKMTAKDLRVAGISFVKPKTSKYPVEKRLEAVTLHMACGNMRQVEAVTGVSYSVLREWHNQDWWKEMEVEIKAARRTAVSTKLNKIVDKALSQVEDRIDNGDWRYNPKDKEFQRVPLSALAVNKVATDLMQRQEAIEKLQQTETVLQDNITIQDTLKHLALEFASFNKKRTIDTKEIEDAVYAEREEGLQEGSSSVYLETGSSEEEGETESSESGDDESGESEEG